MYQKLCIAKFLEYASFKIICFGRRIYLKCLIEVLLWQNERFVDMMNYSEVNMKKKFLSPPFAWMTRQHTKYIKRLFAPSEHFWSSPCVLLKNVNFYAQEVMQENY